MSNRGSSPSNASDIVSTDGHPAPQAAMRAQPRHVQPPPGWHMQLPRIESTEVDGPYDGNRMKKALMFKVESVVKRGQRLSNYEGAVIFAVSQKIKDVYGAEELLPVTLFTCQYVHAKAGYIITAPPSVADAIMHIGIFKVVGEDDNVLMISAAAFDDDLTKARVISNVLFGFVYPKAGATDTDSEVEELVRLGLRSVGLELSNFERAKTREGVLRNCWNIRFAPTAGIDIDVDVLHKLRTVPLTAPSGAPVNVTLAGEFCVQVGICKTCYRKGTCWCTTQSGPQRARMPNNSEMIMRRLIAKQRNR